MPRNMSADATLTARQLAEEAGIAYTRLHHWCNTGLLKFERLNGRIRVFDRRENLRRIRIIQRMQRESEGHSLAAIKRILDDEGH